MKFYRSWAMPLRLAVPLCLALTGGILLVAVVFYHAQRADSRRLFAETSAANADFFGRMGLSPSATMARHLGSVLGMTVYFKNAQDEFQPPLDSSVAPFRARLLDLPPGAVGALGGEVEVVARPVGGDTTLILCRKRPDYLRQALSRWIVLILPGLLLMSILVGWVFTRGVVLPLRRLRDAVAGLEAREVPAMIPGADRADEIGLLARTLENTHGRWLAERAQRQEAERHAALSRIAASFAHEVKNPVAAIRLRMQLLEEAGQAERADMLPDALCVTLRELGRIEKMVSQWMYLVQPAPGERRRADLVELLEESAASCRHMAAHGGVSIVLPGRPARALVDRMRLGMVFDNLFRNAVQAMPGGGCVRVVMEERDGEVLLCWEDEGQGFSESALARGTDLFYTEREGGMGVGLSVCAAIIEAHGGSIRLANRENGGGCVRLCLPDGDGAQYAGTEG